MIIYIYHCGQESLRTNEVATIVNKRVQNAVLGCNLRNNRIISLHFQGKSFSITVTQVYAPTSNAEDLQDLLELTAKKDVLFIIGDWNAEVGSQETPGVTGKFRLGIRNEATHRVLPRKCTDHSKHSLPTTKRQLYKWTAPDGQYKNQIDYILWSQR